MLKKAAIPPNRQEHEELSLYLQSYSKAQGFYSYITQKLEEYIMVYKTMPLKS